MTDIAPTAAHHGGARPARRSTRRRRVGYSVVAAVVVVAGAGTGAAAYAAGVVGRGAEPEAIAPASSIAFMRLDLNPSLGQKLDLARFSAAFPGNGSHLKTYAGLRDDFIESMAGGADDPVPLSSWFAGRAAVAAYPDAAAASGVTPIGIVQYTDETAMLKEMAHESTVEDDFGFAVDTAHHYVVVSSSVAAATRALAAARAQPLSANPTFRADLASLPQDDDPGIVWGDLTASRRALVDVALATPLRQSGATAVPGLEKSPVYGVGQSAATDARVVVGIRVEPRAVDVVGRLHDVPASTTTPAGVPGTALAGLSGLPDNVLGAMSVSGLGAAAGDAYTQLVARSPSVVGMLSDAGVGSAADVRALLGSVATVDVEPTGDAADPMTLLSVTSADPARGLAVARRLESSYGTALGAEAPSISTSGGRLLIRFPAGAKPVAGAGSLSSSGVFRAAVPDAGSATSIAFVNVQQVLALDQASPAAGKSDAKLKPIAAIGLSTTAGADPGFHLRITLR